MNGRKSSEEGDGRGIGREEGIEMEGRTWREEQVRMQGGVCRREGVEIYE